jgi:hypothetical protein
MAAADKPKFDIPWGTLLPLAAALAGIIAQVRPVISERPTANLGEKTIEAIGDQDVDARLWQDPLAVAQKARDKYLAESEFCFTPTESPPPHSLQGLANKIRKCVKSEDIAAGVHQDPDRLLLLGVMIDAGPYAEQAESRLRSRQAVLEALSESGFVPVDSEHIGFVTSAWPLGLQNAEKTLLLPWEECDAVESRDNVYPRNTARIFVLWLPSTNFSETPLANFASLIRALTETNEANSEKCNVRDRVDVKLIGPVNSAGLEQMLLEVQNWKSDPERDAVLERLTIVSPRATISDEALFYEASTSPSVQLFEFPAAPSFLPGTPYDDQVTKLDRAPAVGGPEGQLVHPLIERNIGDTIRSHGDVRFPPTEVVDVRGQPVIADEIKKTFGNRVHFVRTIASDEIVLAELEAELRLRLNVPRKVVADRRDGDQLVILTEWDSPYGRSLEPTFAALASGQNIPNLEKDQTLCPQSIHRIRYLRGIDGRLPGDEPKVREKEAKAKPAEPTPAKSEEATEGLDQSDFLLRLARTLKDDDIITQRQGKGRIRAIGLLGSDVYDKLMILRALRPQFPDAIFFTNNFDSHFERRADWKDVRNLVIASPFGTRLPGDLQSKVPPFRDSSQTSMYLGTLVATEKVGEKTARKLARHPKLFEIGRYGAWDLSRSWHFTNTERVSSPREAWFVDWLRSTGVRRHLMLGLLAVIAMIVWISMSIVDPSLKQRGEETKPNGDTRKSNRWKRRLEWLAGSTVLWLVCGTPIIVFAVAWYSQHTREPLAFLSGISIWPTEMLRLVALMLAVHFMIKASLNLRENERRIEHDFSLDPLPPTGSKWKTLRLGLKRWPSDSEEWVKPGAELEAKDAWHAYLRRNRFGPRFVRIAALFIIYFVFTLAVFTLFPPIEPPARGATAFRFDFWVLILAVISMLILSFYVFDALQLNSNFIRMFAQAVTKWEPAVTKQTRREPPLTDKELSRYHSIRFVAQRTEAVAPLIWYPLIVLAIMFAARSSFFDDWTWPPSLIWIFTLNAVWALGSAAFLRRAAEQLRDTALNSLQLLRTASYSSRDRRRAFDEIIREVRDLKKGAFAPLSEQHFVRAIVLPAGGLGLIAVSQRLLESF